VGDWDGVAIDCIGAAAGVVAFDKVGNHLQQTKAQTHTYIAGCRYVTLDHRHSIGTKGPGNTCWVDHNCCQGRGWSRLEHMQGLAGGTCSSAGQATTAAVHTWCEKAR
jgi:hypothetical protein